MRNYKYDFLKGLLIFGVVYGHIINMFKDVFQIDQNVLFHTIVRTFDMPLFMIIGGILLSLSIVKYKPIKLMANKVGQLAIPTIIFGLLFSIILCLIKRSFSFDFIIRYVFDYWFVWSILICSLVVILISWLAKNRIVRLILLLILSIAFHFIPTNADIFNLSYMYPFFIIGFYSLRISEHIDSKKRYLICALPIYIIMLGFWDVKYNIWNTSGYYLSGDFLFTFGISLFRFFIGLFGSISVFVLLDCAEPFFHKKNLICSFGKETLMIYILHVPLVNVILHKVIEIIYEKSSVDKTFLLNNFNFITCLISPVIAILLVASLFYMILLCRKIPLVGKWIFGNRFFERESPENNA